MDLTDKNTIKQILKDNKIWAKKKLGQHFLVSQKVLDKIIKTADINQNDKVLEIGPGLGVLTQELAKNAKLVLGIEKDRNFVEWLRKYFKGKKNVKIVCDDILTYNLNLITDNYKIVSNLPYQITSPVMRKFLQGVEGVGSVEGGRRGRPEMMVLMVQREMAERITAKAGSSKRGFLTVLVEYYVKNVEIVEIVDKDCFWPVPEVDSAIIRIVTSNKRQVTSNKSIDSKAFFLLVKIGFSQKRRQIHNPLSAALHISKPEIYDILKSAGIDKKLRAEDLSLEEWIELYKQVQKTIKK